MRILLFTTAYRPLVGGSELAIENIARQMPDVSFDILTPRHRSDLPVIETEGNVTVHRIGTGTGADKWLFPVLGSIKALALLRHRKYSLMHAYQASHAAGAALLIKMLLPRVSFLLTLQEGKELTRQNPFVRLFRRFIVERADATTVISRYLKLFVESIRSDIPVHVVPNGVDIERFGRPADGPTSAGLRAKYGLGPDDGVAVSVSRLVEKNGLKKLLEAMPKIDIGRPVRLLLIGEGPLEESLKLKVKSEKLEGRVHFLGTIPHSQLHKYLAVSDVFVRPSLSEGLGNAFLEAMAAGVPIVGSLAGGIGDFLKDGETGLAVDPTDAGSIARQMVRALTDTELRILITAHARTLVSEKYNWAVVASAMRRVYDEIGKQG